MNRDYPWRNANTPFKMKINANWWGPEDKINPVPYNRNIFKWILNLIGFYFFLEFEILSDPVPKDGAWEYECKERGVRVEYRFTSYVWVLGRVTTSPWFNLLKKLL